MVNFQIARRQRDAARKRLRVAESSVRKLERSLSGCFDRLDVAEDSYELMDRHADSAFRARRSKKAWRKVARRRAYASQALRARRDARQINRQLAYALEARQGAKTEYELAVLRYSAAKHLLVRSMSASAPTADVPGSREVEYA